MRIPLLLISFFISSVGFSQDSIPFIETVPDHPMVLQVKPRRHNLELTPVSIWLNKGFFYGHRISYRLHISRSMMVELESNGTLFRSLDDRASQLNDGENDVFPLLNQSTGVFIKDIYGMGKMVNRNKQKRLIFSLRLGYQFFQHATPYLNNDYWAFDSTAQEGLSSIRSFQSHSLSLGLGFRANKNKRRDGRMKRVASHMWSLDYLASVNYQLSAYSVNDANNYNVRKIPNTYALRRSGARFNYRYTRYLNSNFGIHFGAEAVYVPFLKDYTPTSYFTPRGGERIVPLFTNMHAGVTFVF